MPLGEMGGCCGTPGGGLIMGSEDRSRKLTQEIEDVVFGFGTPWVKSYFLPELQFLYL